MRAAIACAFSAPSSKLAGISAASTPVTYCSSGSVSTVRVRVRYTRTCMSGEASAGASRSAPPAAPCCLAARSACAATAWAASGTCAAGAGARPASSAGSSTASALSAAMLAASGTNLLPPWRKKVRERARGVGARCSRAGAGPAARCAAAGCIVWSIGRPELSCFSAVNLTVITLVFLSSISFFISSIHCTPIFSPNIY
ncbi:hypothetical protein D3C73_679900 [compost metagenome]